MGPQFPILAREKAGQLLDDTNPGSRYPLSRGETTMNTVNEIERAIEALSPGEREELQTWMDANCPQSIDAQLEDDLASGRMDERIRRALASHKAGDTQPL
jgi:hypothetical protein